MKILAGIFGVFFLSCVFAGCVALGTYNGLVVRDENVSGSWSEVQSQMKRRNDLIPQLVESVKGAAGHESGVFTEVAASRARVGQAINVDVSKLAGDPELQKKLLEANKELQGSLSRLLAVAENYPTLKVNENFMALQTAIEGTENRITVARGRAIEATQAYNKGIRVFPGVLIASFAGFDKKEYYEATQEEQQVPKFSFSEKDK